MPRDKVRALQHTLYRTAKADPGRRFHTLWDKVPTQDVLWRAWVAVRRNDGALGIDKLTVGAVEEHGIARFLAEVEAELREGRYRPLAARQMLIPKPGQPGQQRPHCHRVGSRSDRAGRGEDCARGSSAGSGGTAIRSG